MERSIQALQVQCINVLMESNVSFKQKKSEQRLLVQ